MVEQSNQIAGSMVNIVIIVLKPLKQVVSFGDPILVSVVPGFFGFPGGGRNATACRGASLFWPRQR